MKTTLYVALERLVDISNASAWRLDQTLAASLKSHHDQYRIVAAFAPHRFGLIFDSQDEIDEAWNYMRNWLLQNGIQFEQKCIVLKHDADTSQLNDQEDAWWLANEADTKAWAPNIRFIPNLPAASLPFAHRLKRIIAAALMHN